LKPNIILNFVFLVNAVQQLAVNVFIFAQCIIC